METRLGEREAVNRYPQKGPMAKALQFLKALTTKPVQHYLIHRVSPIEKQTPTLC